MAKEPDLASIASKLIDGVGGALEILEEVNTSLESRPLKTAIKALKTASKAADKLVKVAEDLLDELSEAEAEEEDDEDDDDDWDDDD